MKALAGSILVLAGCVLLASGVIAEAVVLAANRAKPDSLTLPIGGGLVVCGLVVFVVGWVSETGRRGPPPTT
jgi:uncharacterized membrane protein